MATVAAQPDTHEARAQDAPAMDGARIVSSADMRQQSQLNCATRPVVPGSAGKNNRNAQGTPHSARENSNGVEVGLRTFTHSKRSSIFYNTHLPSLMLNTLRYIRARVLASLILRKAASLLTS
jgi:hypothetical protein